ncbi:MAG: glycosyltransferase family 2 protein [Ignavibacteria bacterium]|nr:glycosyltransferase family 2 protein [Ignavibacteria bacterium]
MDIREQHIDAPYFSICIPQHNRTSFLLEALRALEAQEFRDFEVCIADDQSTDGREGEIVDFLRASGLSFAYRKNVRNLRYDGNLRASMELARGRYCLLHGNDDCLKDAGTLRRLHDLLEAHGRPAVALTNFEDWSTGEVTRRVAATALLPGVPETAAAHFRNVAFVTGVTLDREAVHAHSTERWDGSEMYQMYLMARIIALGGTLLEIEESMVRKDIQVDGEMVDSIARVAVVNPCPIIPGSPVTQIARVVTDGIAPALEVPARRKLNARILRQLYIHLSAVGGGVSVHAVVEICGGYQSGVARSIRL